jgi:hypothetical protein
MNTATVYLVSHDFRENGFVFLRKNRNNIGRLSSLPHAWIRLRQGYGGQVHARQSDHLRGKKDFAAD